MPEAEKPESTGPESAPLSPAGLRRRWLLNGALLVVIGLLGWLAFHRAGQEKDVAGPPLTSLLTEAVSRVRIERPEQAAIVLEKSGADWTVTSPVRARANSFNVENLLRVASAPGETRFPAKADELAGFKLDKPVARLWLNDREIAFGSLHPLNNLVYVLHSNEVVLIPGHHLGPVLYPYANYLDSRLFEEDRKLVALKLPGFSVARKDAAWQRKPPDRRLTTDRLNEFAAEWQNARALGVEKYSGGGIISRIEISSERAGKKETLQLGILAYKPEFVLLRQDENLEYHFTEQTGKRLLNLSTGEK